MFKGESQLSKYGHFSPKEYTFYVEHTKDAIVIAEVGLEQRDCLQ